VTEPRFTTTRWRAGYRTDDVDDLLADVLPRLSGRPDPELVRRITEARFATVTFSSGYDMAEVDAFLDDLAAQAAGGPSAAT
jgi:DivIVA domain-containing protein